MTLACSTGSEARCIANFRPRTPLFAPFQSFQSFRPPWSRRQSAAVWTPCGGLTTQRRGLECPPSECLPGRAPFLDERACPQYSARCHPPPPPPLACTICQSGQNTLSAALYCLHVRACLCTAIPSLEFFIADKNASVTVSISGDGSRYKCPPSAFMSNPSAIPSLPVEK